MVSISVISVLLLTVFGAPQESTSRRGRGAVYVNGRRITSSDLPIRARTLEVTAFDDRVDAGIYIYSENKDGRCGGEMKRYESGREIRLRPPFTIACYNVFEIAP